jgi:hypothetical protein
LQLQPKARGLALDQLINLELTTAVKLLPAFDRIHETFLQLKRHPIPGLLPG